MENITSYYNNSVNRILIVTQFTMNPKGGLKLCTYTMLSNPVFLAALGKAFYSLITSHLKNTVP